MLVEDSFSALTAIRWMECFANALMQNEARLTELDAAIGDADHGVNMCRVATSLLEKLQHQEEADLETLFRTTSMAFMSIGGGASGPLYGSFFQGMGGRATGQKNFCMEGLVNALEAGTQRVTTLGKAVAGDKTLVDVLLPCVASLRASSLKRQSLQESLEKCAEVAAQAARATIAMQAHKGRASYLGVRSVGHEDPGAASAQLLFETLRQAFL
ncbi:MAG: dihydroxyacetone kinase subunit DhaL [Chthoniobacteraceae bacterium]